jgi:hypothetical protein
VWQWQVVLKHVRKITAVDPAAARGTADEVLGLVLRRIAEKLTDVLAARDRQGMALRSSLASYAAGNEMPPT